MQGYYNILSAERLKKCYDIAPPRTLQYLNAEIEFVKKKITPSSYTLELGCGFGRILKQIESSTDKCAGVDTSIDSLIFGKKNYLSKSGISFLCMNALKLGFKNNSFDNVLCLQNGISAFHSDKLQLLKEAIRVTSIGGRIIFSSYSDKFWNARLEWFELQAREKLIGEIDRVNTGRGTIICKDGFKATTISPEEFSLLAASLDVIPKISEVDASIIFFEIIK